MRTDLEQALLRDRHNVRLWAVYADWLESAGDVRGALSSLMLKREAAPSRAMEEALQAQAPLLASLMPTSLGTLDTRGSPRLAPVFRRGFLFSGGATQASDVEALVTHPSAAFLDTVLLESAELAEWFGSVSEPLPWRMLELNASEIELTPLAPHVPFLQTLRLEAPCDELTFAPIPSLRRVQLRGPSTENLAALLEAELPALEVIELLAPRGDARTAPELDALVEVLAPRVARLSRVVLEGTPGPATARLVEQHRHVLVRTALPPERLFPTPLYLEGPEASFAVVRGALKHEHRETLTAFAKLAGAKRLTLTESVLDFGSGPLTVLQFNGEGEVPIVPRIAVQQLAKKDRTLDAASFTVSVSNNVASAWSVGPHVAFASDLKKRTVMPVSRRDEGAYTRDELTRAVLGALAGLDPGLDVLEELLDLLDRGSTHVLIGASLEQGERLPLFTDFAPAPPEEEEYEEEEDDGDEEEYQLSADDDGWDPVDPWGAAPVNVPDFGPVEASAPEGEEEPDEDLDPPLHDASSADEEELWVEGPVELPEHHDSLPGDRIAEPELELLERPQTTACPRCQQHGETERCVQCLEEVCRECAGPAAHAAWDEQRDFSCFQCEPLWAGRFVRPRAS